MALYRSGLSQTQNKLIEIQLDWFGSSKALLFFTDCTL